MDAFEASDERAWQGSKLRAVLHRVLVLKRSYLACALAACEPGSGSVAASRATEALWAAGAFLGAQLGQHSLVLDCGFSGAFRDASGGGAPYEAGCFGGRIIHFSPGHQAQPPSLAALVGACTSALAWLRAHPGNVVLLLAPSALHYAVTLSALASTLHAASAHAPDRLSAAAVAGAAPPSRPSDERILLAVSRALLPDAAVAVAALGAEGRATALADAARAARAAADDEDVAAAPAAPAVTLPVAYTDARAAVVAAVAVTGAALTDEAIAAPGGGAAAAAATQPRPPGAVDAAFAGAGAARYCPVLDGGVLLLPAVAGSDAPSSSPLSSTTAKWRSAAAAVAARLTGGAESPGPAPPSPTLEGSSGGGGAAASPPPSSSSSSFRVFPWLTTAAVRQVRLYRELVAARGALVAWDAPPAQCCHRRDAADSAAALVSRRRPLDSAPASSRHRRRRVREPLPGPAAAAAKSDIGAADKAEEESRSAGDYSAAVMIPIEEGRSDGDGGGGSHDSAGNGDEDAAAKTEDAASSDDDDDDWTLGGPPAVTSAAGAAGAESLPLAPLLTTLPPSSQLQGGKAMMQQTPSQTPSPPSALRRPASSRLVAGVSSLLRVASRGSLRASAPLSTAGAGAPTSSSAPSSAPASPLVASNPIASANANAAAARTAASPHALHSPPSTPSPQQGGGSTTRSARTPSSARSPPPFAVAGTGGGGGSDAFAGVAAGASIGGPTLLAPPAPALLTALPYSFVFNLPHGDLGVRVSTAKLKAGAGGDDTGGELIVTRSAYGGVGSFIGAFLDDAEDEDDAAPPLPQRGRLLRRCESGCGLVAWRPGQRSAATPSSYPAATPGIGAAPLDPRGGAAAARRRSLSLPAPREDGADAVAPASLEAIVRPSPRVVLRYLVLSAAPSAQQGEVLHTEAGCCPAVMVLASDPTGAGSAGAAAAAGGGSWRLIFSSLVQGRRRFRRGHGPVIIPLHVAVHGEAVVRLFDLTLSGEGVRLCTFRVHAGLLAPADAAARRGTWATVTHVGRRELGIASNDARFPADFHVSLAATALPPRFAQRPLYVPLIAPPRFVDAESAAEEGSGSSSSCDSGGDVAPDLVHVVCSTAGCGEVLRLTAAHLAAAVERVQSRTASRSRLLRERIDSAATTGVAVSLVSHDYDDVVERPLLPQRGERRGDAAAAAARDEGGATVASGTRAQTPSASGRRRRHNVAALNAEGAAPAVADAPRCRPSIECGRCGQLQYVPAIAAVLAGAVSESDANARVIPPLDARVATFDAQRAARHAHPFDVASDAAAGEGVALRGMVAARKRARADEEAIVARLVREFGALGEAAVRTEYRAVVIEDGGSFDDLLAQLVALRESAADGGDGPAAAAARRRPALEWAESAPRTAVDGGSAGPLRPTTSAAAGNRAAGAVALSLPHRVGLAAQRAGAAAAAADDAGVLYAHVADASAFYPSSPLRPGVRLRTPYGGGPIIAVRLATRAPAAALPPATPLECEVAGFAVALSYGVAFVGPDSARMAPVGDAEGEERRRAAIARRGTAGASTRAAGTGRARRMADQAADADAALARRLQAEAIAEALAEDGEDDVDVRRLMYDADGLQLMRDTLHSAVPGLRGGDGGEDEDAEGDADGGHAAAEAFNALPRPLEVLFASVALMRHLAAATKAANQQIGGRSGGGGADDEAGPPPRGAGVISATPPALQDARADAALRVLVADTVFDRASVRAADPDTIAALPLLTFDGEAETERAAGGGGGVDPAAARVAGGGGGGTECVVCRDDFVTGDTLRRLPCGHRWHARCVDPWLLTDARCPLCGASVMQQLQQGRPALSAAPPAAASAAVATAWGSLRR